MLHARFMLSKEPHAQNIHIKAKSLYLEKRCAKIKQQKRKKKRKVLASPPSFVRPFSFFLFYFGTMFLFLEKILSSVVFLVCRERLISREVYSYSSASIL